MSGPARRWMLLCSILGVVRIAASLAFVWVCKELVDVATGIGTAPLTGRIILMLGIMLIQYLSNISIAYCENYAILTAKNSLRARLFGCVMDSRWSGLEKYRSGDAVNRLEEDISCLLYTSPSPRDRKPSRMPSSA